MLIGISESCPLLLLLCDDEEVSPPQMFQRQLHDWPAKLCNASRCGSLQLIDSRNGARFDSLDGRHDRFHG